MVATTQPEPTEEGHVSPEEAWTAWAAAVQRSLDEIRLMAHAAGRAAVGSNVLLSHWMARSGGSGASETDLAEALAAASREAWSAQLRALGVRVPDADDPKEIPT